MWTAATVVTVTALALGARAGDELPRDTEPVAYGLQLAPRYDPAADEYAFGGHVEIWIRVNAITSVVTLHARDLQIKSVAIIESRMQVSVDVDYWTMLADEERLVIGPGDHLLAGRVYQVRIMFQGLLRTDTTGFYRSLYMENGQQKWLAVTQFKPTYARRAFPCYDEPRYKTPFNISLGRLENQTTLSNTGLNSTQRLLTWLLYGVYNSKIRSHMQVDMMRLVTIENYVNVIRMPLIDYYGIWLDQYNPTEPITTYLVSALVGQLKKSERVNGSDVNVYANGESLSRTMYTQEETPAMIATMEDYTDVPSETAKIDLLALPDFGGDGAEGWGVQFYRERYLLSDEDAKTKFTEQSTMVLQQQQSHQWFGTLVTCKQWDFMWLNEGLAKYFQYFATKTREPSWRLEDLFVVEQHQTALEYDQTPRHPINVPVNGSDDIPEAIDRITYNKAAAVMRMIRYVVTENYFHQPLKLYLRNFKHSTASPSDLWAVFENYYFDNGFKLQEHVSFTDFALTWTDQSGYPVVTVVRKNRTLNVYQTRFSIWPTAGDADGQWYVGLTYTDSLEKNFEDLTTVRWLKPKMTEMRVNNINASAKWWIFNLQSTGFYRVNYDNDNWRQLVLQLNTTHREIHVLNRAQLIDDSFNLARAGLLDYAIALDLSTYLNNEDDYIPWYAAMDCLSYVVERMRRSDQGYDYIKSYVGKLADTIYDKAQTMVLEFSSEDHTTITSWNKFSTWACRLGGAKCTWNAMGNFKKFLTNQKISPEIKDATFCTGVRTYNDTETWKGMFNVYVTTKSASEKDSAQYALTCMEDTALLYKYLNFLFDADKCGPVRLHDYMDICEAMALTPSGIEALTGFLMNNIEKILKTVLAGETIVTDMYRLLASKVALDSEIIKLYQLKNSSRLPAKIKASFDQSYVQVEQNLRWFDSYHAGINRWTGAPLDPEPLTTPAPEPSTTTTSAPSTTTTPAQSTTTTPAQSTTTTPQPNTTEPVTNMTTFDFEDTTPTTITRCPSGAPPNWLSSAPIVGISVTIIIFVRPFCT